MKAFRSRAVVIQAQQWYPPGHELHDPSLLVHRKGNQVDPPDYLRINDLYCAIPDGAHGLGGAGVYMIKTTSGNQRISPGDWVVIGLEGEKYPVVDSVFRAKYEEEGLHPAGTVHNYSCLKKVADDEPIFVLRAQDELAPMVVDYWACLLELSNSKNGKPQSPKVPEARAQAELMRKWPNRKIPD